MKKDGFHTRRCVAQLSLFSRKKRKKTNNEKKYIFNHIHFYSYILVYFNEGLLQHWTTTPHVTKIIFDNMYKGFRMKGGDNINIMGFYNTHNRKIHNYSLDIHRSDEKDTTDIIKKIKNKTGEKLIKDNNKKKNNFLMKRKLNQIIILIVIIIIIILIVIIIIIIIIIIITSMIYP
ncbi:hypothetical protein PFFCH_01879 [Plasmodium falciparum FCH/4]|uniref:Uncharacterized protein n=1 Tax=Plasmodium falciparum FCH/4 TaxID=1036724 RepID=A0A024VS29_PLAFA|nr:hypothetical protein PFFCH_01879 [Plasmodium falciparum FCH/4]